MRGRVSWRYGGVILEGLVFLLEQSDLLWDSPRLDKLVSVAETTSLSPSPWLMRCTELPLHKNHIRELNVRYFLTHTHNYTSCLPSLSPPPSPHLRFSISSTFPPPPPLPLLPSSSLPPPPFIRSFPLPPTHMAAASRVRLLLGQKAMNSGLPGSWRVLTHLPVVTSHTLTVSSSDPESKDVKSSGFICAYDLSILW